MGESLLAVPVGDSAARPSSSGLPSSCPCRRSCCSCCRDEGSSCLLSFCPCHLRLCRSCTRLVGSSCLSSSCPCPCHVSCCPSCPIQSDEPVHFACTCPRSSSSLSSSPCQWGRSCCSLCCRPSGLSCRSSSSAPKDFLNRLAAHNAVIW